MTVSQHRIMECIFLGGVFGRNSKKHFPPRFAAAPHNDFPSAATLHIKSQVLIKHSAVKTIRTPQPTPISIPLGLV
jgi:hypothetical protein